MKNIKKFRAFNNQIKSILIKNNFQESNDLRELDTYTYRSKQYGRLVIHLEKNTNLSKACSIFCRFEDEISAKLIIQKYAGNLYSGKCNFHSLDENSAIGIFNSFINDFFTIKNTGQ